MKKTVRLWTIQSKLQVDNNKKKLVGNWKFVDKDFKPAYRMLIRQMPVVPLNNHPPMWAWTTKPSYKSPGDYLISFIAPRELLLVTDFQLWHLWLMGNYSVKILRKRLTEKVQVCLPYIDKQWIDKVTLL